MKFDFEKSIKDFNNMYKMPVSEKPNIQACGDFVTRLYQFQTILIEEINETEDIVADIDLVEDIDSLVALADLLGDIQVYCASEMAKFGLPINPILKIIMDSNFSKLDENGNPIVNELGKIEKGPNYWKPEPKIKELLLKLMEDK